MDEDDPLPKETLQAVLDELEVKEKVTEMQWVVKYTAVVKERGVVENKGYANFNSDLISGMLYLLLWSKCVLYGWTGDSENYKLGMHTNV